MHIGIGCDHAGFEAKEEIGDLLGELGHDVEDYGTHDDTSTDYPDFARRVGRAIVEEEVERGILLCGSGIGVAVAANKISGIRASVCHDTYSARQGVRHDDLNVLCLGARVVGPDLMDELVRAFVDAEFSGAERHRRRLRKVDEIEQDACNGVFDP
jgi:ribose 5-phosphate isomerase B